MRSRLRSESHRCYRYTIPDESDVVSDVVGARTGSLHYVLTVLSCGVWSGCGSERVVPCATSRSEEPQAGLRVTKDSATDPSNIHQARWPSGPRRHVKDFILNPTRRVPWSRKGREFESRPCHVCFWHPARRCPSAFSFSRVSVLALSLPVGTADLATVARHAESKTEWRYCVSYGVVLWKSGCGRERKACPQAYEEKKDGGGLGVWPGKRTWCNRRATLPRDSNSSRKVAVEPPDIYQFAGI